MESVLPQISDFDPPVFSDNLCISRLKGQYLNAVRSPYLLTGSNLLSHIRLGTKPFPLLRYGFAVPEQ